MRQRRSRVKTDLAETKTRVIWHKPVQLPLPGHRRVATYRYAFVTALQRLSRFRSRDCRISRGKPWSERLRRSSRIHTQI